MKRDVARKGGSTANKPVAKPIFATATIDDVAPGGDGVAHVMIGEERRAVFVSAAARGDEVELAIDASQRPARGKIVHLVKGSDDRVEPACVHVDRCGGCDWMHLSIEAQKTAHLDHVRRALPPVWRGMPLGYFPAEVRLAERSRSRVHIRASGGRVVLGMHASGTRDPVEVDICIIVHPKIDAARKILADILDGAHGFGEAQLALGLFKSETEGEKQAAVVDLRWSGPLPAEVFGRFEAATLRGDIAGARVRCGETSRPAIIGDPTPWTVGGDGAPLRLAPGGFAQTSESTNQHLAKRVAELIPESGGRGLELFAGAGNLTVLLCTKLSPLVAVESDEAACEAARQNLLARGVAPGTVKLTAADAGSYVVPPNIDVVVLDPPRTGAFAAVTRLAAKPPKHVVYISCDPPTLGRDLAVLAAAGMVCTSIDVFEMFPQTSHVETVVALERKART